MRRNGNSGRRITPADLSITAASVGDAAHPLALTARLGRPLFRSMNNTEIVARTIAADVVVGELAEALDQIFTAAVPPQELSPLRACLTEHSTINRDLLHQRVIDLDDAEDLVAETIAWMEDMLEASVCEGVLIGETERSVRTSFDDVTTNQFDELVDIIERKQPARAA